MMHGKVQQEAGPGRAPEWNATYGRPNNYIQLLHLRQLLQCNRDAFLSTARHVT
jgi:hypothetical protein